MVEDYEIAPVFHYPTTGKLSMSTRPLTPTALRLLRLPFVPNGNLIFSGVPIFLHFGVGDGQTHYIIYVSVSKHLR